MLREEILRLLRQQPFRPIRLRLSNGVTHEIRHPDMAIVTPHVIHVGVPKGGTGIDAAAEDIVVISMLHVVQAETMMPATSPLSN
jgi:hypothetical protein